VEALRLITESRNSQVVIDLPPSFERCKLEVIVMSLESTNQTNEIRKRPKPSPMLAGSVRLKDDLISPAVSETDWDVLQ